MTDFADELWRDIMKVLNGQHDSGYIVMCRRDFDLAVMNYEDRHNTIIPSVLADMVMDQSLYKQFKPGDWVVYDGDYSFTHDDPKPRRWWQFWKAR